MNKNNLETSIYEYGHIQYKIGRMETDDKVSSKEYAKAIAEKDKLVKVISDYFKQN